MKERIVIELPENDALTLAQFFKRITWAGVNECAVDRAETEHLIRIVENCRSQLEKQGIAPR
jgi:hypothetical protein